MCDAICESKRHGTRSEAECAVTLRLGQSAALPGSQIAFQINTALVNTIKSHYTALVNVTEYAHRRVIFKTAFLRAMQFAKASTEAERSAKGAE